MTKDESKPVVVRDPTNRALEVAAFVSSAVPWVGGPISNVLGGISTQRKLDRVNEVLRGFAEDLQDFESEASKQYVKTEGFEDLLEETLRHAAAERTEEIRRAYRTFLVRSVMDAEDLYDEQMRVLRVLEELQAGHILVLGALTSEPDEDPNALSGSQLRTLDRRIPELTKETIEQLAEQLNDLRVTKLTGLRTMMTARGASDLRHCLMPLGESLLRYIRTVPEETSKR
ncbi:MAG: hypothetical protein ACQGVK_09940 [Myxococcota bacterium]